MFPRRLEFVAAVLSLSILLCQVPATAAIALDQTFGTGGKVTLAFPDSSLNYSAFGLNIWVQPAGRIVVGGVFSNQGPDGQFQGVALAGLLSNGKLDPGFGNAGTFWDWNPIAITTLSDAVMDPEGRVLRLSQVFSIAGPPSAKLVRSTTSGVDDSGFAADINVTGAFETIPLELVVRQDGKLLVLVVTSGQPYSYHLFRLNANGSRDTTFGNNGLLPVNFARVDTQTSFQMVLQPDGKILLAGILGGGPVVGGHPRFYLMRLTANGIVDKTFAQQGVLRMPFGDGLRGSLDHVLVQPDGKILLTGGIADSQPKWNVWMARFTPRGLPDRTFGTAGTVNVDIAGTDDGATAVVIGPDNKIRIAGNAGTNEFLIARFSPTGALEDHGRTSFTPGEFAIARSLALQPDGKIVALGYTKNPNAAINGNVFAIARFVE